jgi:hypothetical protein
MNLSLCTAPNKRMKPTLLSRVFVRVFSVLKRIGSSLDTLRQPQGGLCAIRWAAATKAFAVERRAILSLQKSSAF